MAWRHPQVPDYFIKENSGYGFQGPGQGSTADGLIPRATHPSQLLPPHIPPHNLYPVHLSVSRGCGSNLPFLGPEHLQGASQALAPEAELSLPLGICTPGPL